MKINDIKLYNFRNIENMEIEPHEKTNIIYGLNAQGKTNLIEGIWLFSGFKSFRGSHDKEMISFGKNEAKLKMSFYGGERNQSAEIKIFDKRQVSLNGVELKSPSELTEETNVVVFTPDYLSIIKDGPYLRRRFLNNAISSVYKTYGEQLKKYNRALQQRNSILKNLKYNNYLEPIIEDYEAVLAAYGERIISARKKYLLRLMEHMPDIFSGLTKNREYIEASYMAENLEECSREELAQRLKEVRKEDVINGTTSVGPHRDDVIFKINDIDVRNFGSQGQQRSTVLALKLSEAELLREISGEEPVALLDDCLSELDPYRQDYIMNHIKNWQVFITCCDPSALERLEGGKTFRLEGGKII